METSRVKQPLKVLEIPLSKFSDEVIPVYQSKYDKQKAIVHKLLAEENNVELRKQIVTNKTSIRQLRDLMYELDGLRLQVEDCDIQKFDAKTLTLRKSIITLITGYTGLNELSQKILNNYEESVKEYYSNPFEGANQIMISEDLEELKLREYDETCAQVEALHQDVNDLHAIFGQCNQLIQVQGESVQDISENVGGTANNLSAGLKHLQVAHRLKTTAYPMTGAVLGGMLGGPIGVVAGAKVGGLAALICAIAGYASGKIYKNVNEEIISQTTTFQVNELQSVPAEGSEKKNI